MDYKGTLDFLFSQLPMFQRVGAPAFKKDLSNITTLCDFLANPQKDLKIIHIAGTNGKGSVAHFISSVLQEAGFKVGLYTSPHYVDFRERIKIDGKWIDESSVIEFVDKYSSSELPIEPSFFELTVAMAFYHFAGQEVDFAVIETGLGGRLDSTNIVYPLVSVITNISLDHQSFLGNTIPSIAREKAGIIKDNTPVIIGEFESKSADVFKEVSKDRSAELVFADRSFTYATKEKDLFHSKADILSNGNLYLPGVEIPFFPDYQWKNAITTITAIQKLKEVSQIEIPFEMIRNGLLRIIENTRYIPRTFAIKSNPVTIWDSAHNIGGLKALINELESIGHNTMRIVFSSVKDKDLSPILDLFPEDAVYYFCAAEIPRALMANELLKLAEDNFLKGKAYDSCSSAYEHALNQSMKDDLIVICGSIFMIGELMKNGKLSSFGTVPFSEDPSESSQRHF